MTEAILLQILKDYIHEKESKVCVTEALLEAAKRHQVEAIVFFQTKTVSLTKAYYAAVYYDKQRRNLQKEIKNLLTDKKIPFFFVKGLAIADNYPMPALRTMGDIDLVVKDKENAKNLLTAAGYSFKEEEFNGWFNEWHFYKCGIEFELHDQLMYEHSFITEEEVRYFNKCWEYVSNNELDWNYHFILLVAHLRKHLFRGVGFRQFLDIAILIKYRRSLFNWLWIKNELNTLGLLDFTEICFGLIKQWFEVEAPFDISSLDEKKVKIITKEIFDYGVFGDSSDSLEIRQGYSITKSSSRCYCYTVMLRILKKAFPPYEFMIRASEYNVLKGRRYLLPFFWFYRFIRNLFKPHKWRKLKDETYISQRQYYERNEKLKRWGL